MSKGLPPFDVCFFLGSLIIWQSHKKNTQLHHVTSRKVELCFICNMGRHSPKNRTIAIKNDGAWEHVSIVSPFKHGGFVLGVSRIVSWGHGLFFRGFMRSPRSH